MSDEQPPSSSLRLKPRANSDPASPPPSASPAAPAPPPAADAPTVPLAAPATPEPTAPQATVAEPMKFRLKPKTPPPEGLLAETPVPFSNPPLLVVPPAQDPVAPVAQVAQTPLAPPLPPFATVPSVKPMVPPFPVANTPPSIRPSAPQHLQTPRSVTGLPPISAPPPASLPTSAPPERSIKADKWLAGIVVLVVVLLAATWGVRELFKSNPKPKATAKSAPASAEEKPATSAPAAPASAQAKLLPGGNTRLVDNPQSNAGKAVARARDMVAAIEQRDRTEGVSSVLDDPAAPSAAVPTPAPGAATAQPQKVLNASTPPRTPVVEEVPAAQTEPAVPPSDAFRQFVVNLRVNGVFQGENPRAMLNSKMYNVGTEVDATLAITLFKIDPEAKQLIFRDDSGAILSRRY